MIINNPKELKILREGGKRLADILRKISGKVAPGIPTKELDKYAEELINEAGAQPAFKHYKPAGAAKPYPAALCVSVNDEIVHAPPSGRIFKRGDIVSLDLGVEFGGYFTDAALTLGVGEISEKDKALIAVTKGALDRAISVLKAGIRLGDLGWEIQSYVESRGFGVVRDLVGHGVGKSAHEEPEIPNWGKSGTGLFLEKGMVIALEPMVSAGDFKIKLAKNGWTWKTKDGSKSAHFEHTVVIEKGGALVLTE